MYTCAFTCFVAGSDIGVICAYRLADGLQFSPRFCCVQKNTTRRATRLRWMKRTRRGCGNLGLESSRRATGRFNRITKPLCSSPVIPSSDQLQLCHLDPVMGRPGKWNHGFVWCQVAAEQYFMKDSSVRYISRFSSFHQEKHS